MTTSDTIDPTEWEQLARSSPRQFEDDVLDLLGHEKRDDALTRLMLDIVLAASADDSVDVDTMDRCIQAYDVMLSYRRPVQARRLRLDGEHVTDDVQTIQALVRVVLEQQDCIAGRRHLA